MLPSNTLKRLPNMKAKHMPTTQPNAKSALLSLLEDQRWHPYFECEEVAGNRYGARMDELRKEGYQIESKAYRPRQGKQGHGKQYCLSGKKLFGQGPRVRLDLELSEMELVIVMLGHSLSPLAQGLQARCLEVKEKYLGNVRRKRARD
jgi:hypothetical protein